MVSRAEGETMTPYKHVPHPHLEFRKKHVPKPKAPHKGPLTRFNTFLGDMVTKGVSTMWCAYAFALIAFISLPEAIHTGKGAPRLDRGRARADGALAVRPRRLLYRTAGKRALDVVLAAAGLAVLSPALLFVALAVRLGMGR